RDGSRVAAAAYYPRAQHGFFPRHTHVGARSFGRGRCCSPGVGRADGDQPQLFVRRAYRSSTLHAKRGRRADHRGAKQGRCEGLLKCFSVSVRRVRDAVEATSLLGWQIFHVAAENSTSCLARRRYLRAWSATAYCDVFTPPTPPATSSPPSDRAASTRNHWSAK